MALSRVQLSVLGLGAAVLLATQNIALRDHFFARLDANPDKSRSV